MVPSAALLDERRLRKRLFRWIKSICCLALAAQKWKLVLGPSPGVAPCAADAAVLLRIRIMDIHFSRPEWRRPIPLGHHVVPRFPDLDRSRSMGPREWPPVPWSPLPVSGADAQHQ